MQTEELLKPRYKVTNDWPGQTYKKGEILILSERAGKMHVLFNDVPLGWTEDYLKNYPHLFYPLPWYAERKVEEMPEYVRHRNGNVYRHEYRFEKEMYYNQHCNGHLIGWLEVTDEFKDLTPISKEEYDSYLNLKK